MGVQSTLDYTAACTRVNNITVLLNELPFLLSYQNIIYYMFNNVCYLLLKCILSMGKEKKDGNADARSRQKYKTWTDDSNEFMLQWYIDYLKEKPATSTWKQHYHHMCAEALNARFGLGATTQQVDRHFRAFKEKWNWIKVAMDKSGYGFDAGSCKFNIHY